MRLGARSVCEAANHGKLGQRVVTLSSRRLQLHHELGARRLVQSAWLPSEDRSWQVCP